MKKLWLVPLCALVAWTPALRASEVSHREAAEELLAVTNANGMLNQMIEDVRAMQQQEIAEMSPSLPPDKVAGYKKLQDAVMGLIAAQLKWEKSKDDFVTVYVEVFSEDELRGLTAFHKSPLGQKLLAKSPEISKRSMEIGQKRVQEVVPQIEEMTKKFIEQEKAGEPPPAGAPPAGDPK